MNPKLTFSKIIVVFLFAIFPSICLVQAQNEICANAIDDDHDGLIDINDPDCDCPIVEPISLIPNPSFEETTCCPTNRSEMDCAKTWIQASEATTDYLHTCGWMGWDNLPPPLPFPDGEACVGFRNGRFGNTTNPNWKEYVGACLSAPLRANVSYKFQFHIGFTNRTNSPDLNIVFYGSPDCQNLPFGVGNSAFGCPTNGPGWQEMGRVRAGGNNIWRQVEINVTPTTDIYAMAIGPDCVEISADGSIYYFFDNLVLAEQSAFEFDIRPTAHPCDDEMTLKMPHYDTLSYQWYKNGIALIGETQAELRHIYGDGDYQVRIEDMNGGGCKITKAYTYIRPQFIDIQDTTICEGEAMRFGNIPVSKEGMYWDTLKTAENCDSIIQLNVKVYRDPYDTLSAKIFPTEFYQVGDYKYYHRGTYQSVLTSSTGCDSSVYLDLDFYRVYIPSAFTPNGDGFNDVFTIMGTEVINIQKLRVFNRWGIVVYEGLNIPPNDINTGWNGSSKGGNAPEGVYLFVAYVVLDDEKERMVSGSITLVR